MGTGKAGGREKLDRKRTKSIMLRLGKYMLKYWPLFLLAIALTLLGMLALAALGAML